jgi:molybdopterin converting factor small subunit
MRIRVQLFALARQLTGEEFLTVNLPADATVADVRQALVATAPQLAELIRHSAMAINAQYAADSTPVVPDAEIVLIPPVSGG